MKNKMTKFATLALCAGLAACSEYDAGIDPMNEYELAYDAAFIRTFGQPAADQDWGFGSVETRAVTRAVDTWSHTHPDGWESKLDFPQTYEELVKEYGQNNVRNAITEGFDENIAVYYIPKGTTGDVWLNNFNLKDGKSYSFYNFSEIKSLNSINGNGATVSFYNVGTIESFTSCNGDRHTVYNTGTLTVTSYEYIGELYNNGALILKGSAYTDWSDWTNPIEVVKADIPNSMSIYSTDPGIITFPDYTDLKAACDIHNIIYADNGIKIQNDERQYVCAIEVQGTLDVTQGKLQTSYIKADEVKFDGAHIWLLPQGHIDTRKFSMPDEGCEIYGYTGSHALIEAEEFFFRNQNNFADTFSDNIYFNVKGTIDIEERVTKDNGQTDTEKNPYNSLTEYLASQNGQKLDATRFNTEGISAVDGCSDVWTIPDPDETPTPKTYRIIAEDLSATESTDFDFNDVVFDVEFVDATTAKVTVQAAGGTLPIRIDGNDDEYEIHSLLGVYKTNVPINVNAGTDGKTAEPIYIKGDFPNGDAADANKIKVEVQKGKEGEWYELTAITGQPACKICVSTNFEWCDERTPIWTKYPKFSAWVQDTTVDWTNIDWTDADWTKK